MRSKTNDNLTKMFDLRTSLAEDEERRTSHYVVWLTAIVAVAAIVWAFHFRLDEVTRGVGKVIPSSREQVVQSLDPGVLSEMLVREGDRVEKDQVLLRIDDARSGPIFREAFEKWLALSAQAARLRAEAYESELVFPAEVTVQPLLVKQEVQAYLARKRALDEQLTAMKQSIATLEREMALVIPMVRQGVMSEVELLRLRRQFADMQAQIAERRNRYFTDANNELVRVESELAQAKESALSREDVFKRSVIRSPMKGVIKNVQVTTLGAVIPPGQNILEIVPSDEDMLVEAYVKPSEVAFLKLSQPVMVKLTAYDFNKYGGFEGYLEHLSPDTMRDENKQRRPGSAPVDINEGFYRILIRLAEPRPIRKGQELAALPGMTAIVEIKTGQKTVLEYLFRPLQSLSESLRER